jgi:diguanylate cyclase (GGDEF)-like protein
VIASGYFAALAIEYWRGRADGLRSRYLIVGSFGLLSAFYAARVIVAQYLPADMDIAQMTPNLWFALSALAPIVVTIANIVLILAMTNERAEAEQRRLAEFDALTGALNRRATLEKVARALADAGGIGAILLFDLDRFKQINDRFGHSVGDRVLVAFVEIAQRELRALDIFGRIGGEEFMAFVPKADHRGALSVAERIRAGFAVCGVERSVLDVGATVSIGIALATGDDADLDTMLIEADRALYLAKAKGRDRVQSAIGVAA